MVRGCVAVLLVAALIACGVRESPTPATALLEAHGIEPYLVGNLLFIAHWDEDGGRWLVYDVTGDFTPDQLTPPAGVAVPDDAEIGVLRELERGKLYDFHTRSNQIVNIIEGERGDWPFDAGANFIEWWRGSDEPVPEPADTSAILEKADRSAPAMLGKEYAYELYTHCGVRSAVFDNGRRWRAYPPIHDGSGNPKAGWGNPVTKGTMVLVKEDLAVFTSESGQVAQFLPLPPAVELEPCA